MISWKCTPQPSCSTESEKVEKLAPGTLLLEPFARTAWGLREGGLVVWPNRNVVRRGKGESGRGRGERRSGF